MLDNTYFFRSAAITERGRSDSACRVVRCPPLVFRMSSIEQLIEIVKLHNLNVEEVK